MKSKLITDGVRAISLGGVNVFLVDGTHGLTLIDTGFPGKADVILSALSELGWSPGDLKHIVLTHAHIDHIGSLAALLRVSGAQTWIHRLDAPIAERGSGFRLVRPAPSLLMRLLYRLIYKQNVSVEPARIDHRVEDGDVLAVADGLTAIGAPGHCAGQIALLSPGRGVLFAADVCANLFGLGDPLGFEDEAEGRRSQCKLAGLEFRIACFGHGKAITRDAARRFRDKWKGVQP